LLFVQNRIKVSERTQLTRSCNPDAEEAWQCSGEKHQQQQNDKTRIVGFRINKTKCAKNNSSKSFKNAKHTLRLPSVCLLADKGAVA